MIFGVGHHMLVFEDGMVSDGAISVQNMCHAEQSAWKALTYINSVAVSGMFSIF